ncbi:DUF1906 domain-containing protein [Bacillus sp. ISL-47]|uniref:glycoside hydrolase domain-containing protein n=1 Tax=Bacillus sp. ISL-47 TaxID=2819130 RepID=UPI001BEA82FE|nr:glycoside hydrolase domain-containing protein [Bacillus sp. ISL-47]MBT2689456.1 DUF1906 domain-containing protein [Bacillus sp. ISL-47]MBT2708272.1 DUF1906 domain-containing protein [Pseudomonas sp. ISL-84]
MDRRGLLPFIVTAFFAVMISIFTFSLIDSRNAEPNTHQKTNGGESNSDSDITNNVKNNIKGNKANVTNSIDNDLSNGDNSQIDNNVSNDIEVNVDVNVTNKIKNKADSQDSIPGKNGDGNNNSDNDGNKDNNNSGNKDDEDGQTDEDEVVWGVDSASLTTSGLLSCVRDNFGSPKVWGRYLGEKEGVSAGITAVEAELLHSNDIKILVIWNRFSDATGLENGQSEAKAAIKLAEELGIPEGVAIFADIEPGYPVDSAFIEGWYQVMEESPYRPGIYGIFDPQRALTRAFEQAGNSSSALLENTYVWTAAPNVGITTEKQAPSYKPQAPENALIAGWQYGIDAQACNIDTNLFNGGIMDALW